LAPFLPPSDTSDVSAVAAVLPYMYVAIGSSDSGAKPRCSTVAAVPYMLQLAKVTVVPNLLVRETT
jgi:hypothetical protein